MGTKIVPLGPIKLNNVSKKIEQISSIFSALNFGIPNIPRLDEQYMLSFLEIFKFLRELDISD